MLKKYLIFILLLAFNVSVFAQPTVLYSSINTSPRVPLTDMGLFLQGRMQADQAGYQRWAFHKGTVATPDYSQNWRIASTPNALSFSNFLQAGYANGANYFTAGAGVDGEINPAVVGYYYTFNVTKNAFASNDMEVIETSYNPTIISTVTQNPVAASVVANTPVAVTITMASAPAVGELVYLRYSIDGFASSFLVQASFTGNTSVVNIPCQAAGTALSYYVFSSTETLAGLNADVAAFGANSYDMATLNVNNNGGPNYTYTVNAAPTNIIAYASTPYCSNSGTAAVTNTGTLGGVYSSTTGLSINASTGAINLAASTAGTYTVTYTIAADGTCALFTANTMVTITTAPSATIAYAASPYCSNVATATVTITGTTGGTYSSTAGLSLNATTGDINIATSTAGTYTVTYTIAAAGGCPIFTTIAPITITTAPSATTSYGSLPFCSNSGTASAVATGTTGGTYSSTAGLSINAATGAVNLATSTAGTYTVTYTVAAAGGCPAFTSTALITVTAAPNATINYAASPYCNVAGTATVTRSGIGTGGTYSSTTGLVISSTTGDVNTLTSTAGTYTVTYTVAAAGGCTAYSTTTNITINNLSTAPTGATASASLICAASGTVTLTAVGGTLGSGASYKWYAGSCGAVLVGTGSTLTNLPITTTTTYFVRVEGTCNTTTCASVTVMVAPLPVVSISMISANGFTPNAPVVITANVTPTDNYIYNWTKNNANVITTPTSTNNIKVYASDAGNYKVTVTAPSGCTAISNNVFTTSIPEPGKLFIFPNPSTGLFNIAYSNGQANLNGRTINVYDEKGARVYSKKYDLNVPYENMRVDLRKAAKGGYYVELVDGNGKQLAVSSVRKM